MSLTLWQERWTLGIDLMDTEHQCLVKTLAEISARFAMPPLAPNDLDASGPGPGECAPPPECGDLIDVLDGLAELAREHFKHEEDLMRAINYPDLAAHRSEHALLLAEFIEMVRDLERQSVTHLDANSMKSLHQWLVGHMVGADKDYANHYFTLLAEADAPLRRYQSEEEPAW